MSGPRVHELFDGSKIVVSAIPRFGSVLPPTISVLPFASCVWPEQNKLRPYAASVKVPVTGFQTYSLFGASLHASIERTVPFGSSITWTATFGHEICGAHCPT